jgi:hypothetical protein
MTTRNHARHRALALVLLALAMSASSQLRAQELDLADLGRANLEWLRTQVAPNPRVRNPDSDRRGLLVSYDISPDKYPGGYHRSATYDNALAAVAFTVSGDFVRAAFTLHAVSRLVRDDGSLWFSYNTANDWPTEADHESALVRAGATSWAGYAFVFYLVHAPQCAAGDRGCARERRRFLQTAELLASYLLSLQVNDPADPRNGLLRLGWGTIDLAVDPNQHAVIELYHDVPAVGISAENNISAWLFLRELSDLTGDTRCRAAGERIAAALLRALWHERDGQFDMGFWPDGARNHGHALDCASWAALFFLAQGDTLHAQRALATVEEFYPVQSGAASGYRPYEDPPVFENPAVNRFYYPAEPRRQWRDLPVVWSEGTLGVALAYARCGRPQLARELVNRLRPMQAPGSGLRYASLEIPFQFTDAPSVAASAWLVLVAADLDGNPLAGLVWR